MKQMYDIYSTLNDEKVIVPVGSEYPIYVWLKDFDQWSKPEDVWYFYEEKTLRKIRKEFISRISEEELILELL